MTASRTIRHPAATPTQPARRAGHHRARSIAASALAGVAGAVVALSLSACSAGQITQTSSQVAAVPGANVTVGSIALRDLVIAYNGPAGYPAGGTAPLVVRIFNSGTKPVRLVGVSATDAARSVTLSGATPAPNAAATTAAPSGSPSTGPTSAGPGPSPAPTPPTATAAPPPAGQDKLSIEIAPQSYVLLVPGQGQYLQLTGLTKPLTPGMTATVTFTFDDGSTAQAKIPFAPASNVPRATAVVTGGAGE